MVIMEMVFNFSDNMNVKLKESEEVILYFSMFFIKVWELMGVM